MTTRYFSRRRLPTLLNVAVYVHLNRDENGVSPSPAGAGGSGTSRTDSTIMISVPTQNSRRRTNEYMNERVRMYAYFPSVSCCWSTSDQIATTNCDDERNDDERKNDVTWCTRASERATREKRETQQTCSPKRSFSFAPHFEQTMYFIFLSRSLIRFRCELCLIRSHHVGQQR